MLAFLACLFMLFLNTYAAPGNADIMTIRDEDLCGKCHPGNVCAEYICGDKFCHECIPIFEKRRNVDILESRNADTIEKRECPDCPENMMCVPWVCQEGKFCYDCVVKNKSCNKDSNCHPGLHCDVSNLLSSNHYEVDVLVSHSHGPPTNRLNSTEILYPYPKRPLDVIGEFKIFSKMQKNPDDTAKEPKPRSGGRKRAFHSKTRTGCLTCKQRRVKCKKSESRELVYRELMNDSGDETRPVCKRCATAGRACEGYENPLVFVMLEGGATEGRAQSSTGGKTGSAHEKSRPFTVTRSAGVLHRPAALVLGHFKDQHASRSLQFFQERTSVTLARGCSGEDFWREAMLRGAECYPSSVGQLVLALSSIHLSYDRPDDSNLRIRALQYCGNAASRLSREKALGTDTILLSCLLFIGYEYFSGDVKASLVHIGNGLKILEAWKEGDCADQKSGTISQESIDLINTQIMPIFVFMKQVFGALIAKKSPSPDAEQPATYASPNEAMDAMDNIWRALGDLRDDLDSADQEKIASGFAGIRTLMRDWDKATGGNFWTSDPKGITRRKHLQFKIHRKVVSLLMKILAPGKDVVTAANDIDFEEILKLYEDSIPKGQEVTAIENNFLHFELGLIPPLFFTATRACNSLLRRRAIDQLHSLRRKENLWDSCWAAQIARDLLVFDEGTLELPNKPEGTAVDKATVNDLDFFEEPRRAELTFSCYPMLHSAQKWTYVIDPTKQNSVTSSHERPSVENRFLRTLGFQGVVLTQPQVCHCDSSARASFNALHAIVLAATSMKDE
ncbi:MAG: hypothetical protein Q9227_003680 [Pyrenula ochraceoflavens]